MKPQWQDPLVNMQYPTTDSIPLKEQGNDDLQQHTPAENF